MNIKSLELKPNKDTLIKTLQDNTIDRNIALKRFVNICNLIDEGYSIAIDSRWGDGKTFFVKQAKLVIDSLNPNINTSLTPEERNKILSALYPGKSSDDLQQEYIPQVCVYYDAWLNDSDNDPLLSIIYEIVQNTAVEFPDTNINDLIKKAIGIVDIFTKLKGVNVKEALEELLNESDVLREVRKRKELETKIQDFLDSILPERGNRIIVIIDELDRCKPTFAVQLLERIKHYFSNENITFIFSINTEELQHTIKGFYGANFDSSSYLDRFFDLRISLPLPNMEKYHNSIGVSNTIYYYDNMCKLVAAYFNLSMREREKYFRMTKIAAYEITHKQNSFVFSNDKGDGFMFMSMIPLLIALKMKDNDRFKSFINGNSPDLFIELVSNNMHLKNMCSMLFAYNETLEQPSGESIHVDVEDKLREVYNAIFNNKDEYNDIVIGQCSFSTKTREKAIQTLSLLSEYAKYN